MTYDLTPKSSPSPPRLFFFSLSDTTRQQQYGIAALQLMTTVGSTLFHLTRETKFFNLDNVFATSLLSTTAWGLYLAVRHGELKGGKQSLL